MDFARPDGSLPRWIVVAGRNGAGKTTFLQALALAISGPIAAQVLRKSYAGWIHDGAEDGITEAALRSSEHDQLVPEGSRLPLSGWDSSGCVGVSESR